MTLMSVLPACFGRTAIIALTLLSSTVGAEPLGLLDRNGSFVSIEPYAHNIVRITLTERILSSLSAVERSAVLGGNAARIYQLDLRAQAASPTMLRSGVDGLRR